MGLSHGRLTLAEVNGVLGGSFADSLQLLDKINSADLKACLELINKLAHSGKSMQAVARDLGKLSRDLMVAKAAPSVLDCPRELAEELIKKSAEYTLANLGVYLNLFSEGLLRYAKEPRMALEAAVARAIKLYSTDLTAMDARLLKLERMLEAGGLNLAANVSIPAANTSVNTSASLGIENIAGGAADLNASSASSAADGRVNARNGSFSAAGGGKTPTLSAAGPAANGEDFAGHKPAADNYSAHKQAGGVLTAAQLWGRVITYFRKNAPPSFFQVIGRHDPAKIKTDGGIITIVASREDYLALCGDELQEFLKKALLEQGCDYKVLIEKDSSDIDMEKEIMGLTEQFGKKVKIVK